MGLLIDIRNDKRAASGPGAIIFWLAAGTALGVAAALMPAKPLSDSALSLLAVSGGVLGAMVGFYATWGTSLLARILAIPGVIVDALISFTR